MRALAGDIGGTNARLGLFRTDPEGRPVAEARATFESREYPDLLSVVREFLAQVGPPPDRACLAVACPLTDGACLLPNLEWRVDARELGAAIDVPSLRLINDFDALGHGLSFLESDGVEELQAGVPREGAPIALIGAGTGLGEGYLTAHGSVYRVHSSEGGHADFAARTPLECELLLYLREHYGRASWERVLSGPGLLNVYEFLRARDGDESAEVREEMAAGDPARVITTRGVEGSDGLCARALEAFVSAYGAHAGNVALSLQAEAGVYVAGGIAPAILPALRGGAFLEAFRAKGRLAYLMERIPVRVVVDTDAGLRGAAAVALGLSPGAPGVTVEDGST